MSGWPCWWTSRKLAPTVYFSLQFQWENECCPRSLTCSVRPQGIRVTTHDDCESWVITDRVWKVCCWLPQQVRLANFPERCPARADMPLASLTWQQLSLCSWHVVCVWVWPSINSCNFSNVFWSWLPWCNQTTDLFCHHDPFFSIFFFFSCCSLQCFKSHLLASLSMILLCNRVHCLFLNRWDQFFFLGSLQPCTEIVSFCYQFLILDLLVPSRDGVLVTVRGVTNWSLLGALILLIDHWSTAPPTHPTASLQESAFGVSIHSLLESIQQHALDFLFSLWIDCSLKNIFRALSLLGSARSYCFTFSGLHKGPLGLSI